MAGVAGSLRPHEVDAISERSRVDELSDHALWELGNLLNSDDDGKSLWRWLASELGLGNDDTPRIRASPNPGYEVIQLWSSRNDDCSIRVLKNILCDVMKRKDLVKVIEKARENVVYLTVTLLFDGKTMHDLSGRCAGNKPIKDFIKRQIQRKFGCELLSQRRRIVIGMYCRSDRNWSSPASLFKGRQVTLEKFFIKARQENSEKARPVQQRPTVERVAISDTENEIIFQVIDADPLDRMSDHVRQSPPSSDNEEPAAAATGPQPTEQEESPEIQQSQEEEDTNASSAKVIGACQPRDD